MSAEGQRLSPLQEHLLRVREASPGAPWSASIAVRISGPLDAGALGAALERALSRHEILRTRIARPAPDRAPEQLVEPLGPADLQVHDLRSAPEDERAGRLAEIERSLATAAACGDTASPRAALVALGEQEHLLCLAQSSLAADWRSLWNLARELAQALAGGGETDAPVQYADLGEWLRDALEGEDAGTGAELWKRIDLAAARELCLPLESDRGPQPFAAAEIALALPAPAAAALEGLARSHSLPIEAFLLAAWQVLLARLAERSELVIGLSSSGRAFQGLADALGPFARFLPVAARLAEQATLAQLARLADEGHARAEEWHEHFAPEAAEAPGEPLFPYAFEHLPRIGALELGGARFELLRRATSSEPFRCLLRAEERADGFELRLACDPRFLSSAEAAVLLEEYVALLEAAGARPQAPARSLPALSSGMRQRILEQLCPGPALEKRQGCVHEWILETAREHKDAVAVSARGVLLTYRELEERSARLAFQLQRLGVGPGEFVGLHLVPSIELVIAILAVLRAGGAYLPLPPAYPRERIRFMLEDARVKLVLCETGSAAALVGFDGTIAPFDARVLAALPGGEPLERARPSDLAYAIYTSGSTGKPKGVPIAHANLVHSTCARAAHYPERVGSYLLLSSFAFDSSVAGIFWTLVQGGRLVLPPDDLERELAALPGLIARERITHLLALPSLWSLVLEQAREGELDSLRTVIVAGESCPLALVRRHQARLPRARLHDEYGPTEGTVWSTVLDCSAPIERARVPIGRPIPGARAYVVAADGALAPIGFSGELWIGGAGVAQGYLHRPELTAERFAPDPFAPGRIYRTGDRARWLPDGNLEFLGRADDQVKVRGFRIELGEIEAALCAHPSVREAAVVAREPASTAEGRGTRLLAFVIKGGASEEELLRHLGERLPGYMVPARAVLLDQWPRLPNGKIDRGALRDPEEEAARVEPAGALETVLAALFADVLGLERVGRHDDFFALGGHSLLATRLYARLKETLKVDFPLRVLFDRRTPAALAEELLRDPRERARVERLAEVVLQVLELSDEESARALGA